MYVRILNFYVCKHRWLIAIIDRTVSFSDQFPVAFTEKLYFRKKSVWLNDQ